VATDILPGDRDDLERRVCELNGSQCNFTDYLLEEVLSSQDPEIAACLIETSILDRFSAPLCQALCGRVIEGLKVEQEFYGQRFIEWLVEANLFVIPLDDEGYWFRNHGVSPMSPLSLCGESSSVDGHPFQPPYSERSSQSPRRKYSHWVIYRRGRNLSQVVIIMKSVLRRSNSLLLASYFQVTKVSKFILHIRDSIEGIMIKESSNLYRIRVKGFLPDGWVDRLGGLQISAKTSEGVTLQGWLPDQSALAGALDTLHLLRLSILEVTLLENQ